MNKSSYEEQISLSSLKIDELNNIAH